MVYCTVYPQSAEAFFAAAERVGARMIAGKAMLDSMTRFNMPNFTPRLAYLREMKRYGILPADFDPAKQKVDVYDLDRRYWESLWYQPSK